MAAAHETAAAATNGTEKSATRNHYPLATRAQVVALKDAGLSKSQIHAITGVSVRQIQYYYYNNALKRGYKPEESRVLKDEYFVDGKRTGRPRKVHRETTAVD